MHLVAFSLIFGAVWAGILPPLPAGYVDKYSRSDQSSSLNSVPDSQASTYGIKGDWAANSMYCPDGEYGTGYWMYQQANRGKGKDDFASVSMRLVCERSVDRLYAVRTENYNDAGYPTDASWGKAECPVGEYINGFAAKIDKHHGGGTDDRGLTSIKIHCTDDSTQESDVSSLTPKGDWLPMTFCEAGSIVCGMNQKIEKSRGGNDDTGLNAVSLKCCRSTKVYSNGNGYWQLVMAGGGGASITETITYGIVDYSEESMSTTSYTELQASLSMSTSFTYGGATGSVTETLTQTQSTTVTTATLHGITTSYTEEMTVSCPDEDDVALYQYVTSVDENGSNQDEIPFKIQSKKYWCVNDNTLAPQCPFPYCLDSVNCQKPCTQEMGVAGGSFGDYEPKNEYYEPKHEYYEPKHEYYEPKHEYYGYYYNKPHDNLYLSALVSVFTSIGVMAICYSVFMCCVVKSKESNDNKCID